MSCVSNRAFPARFRSSPAPTTTNSGNSSFRRGAALRRFRQSGLHREHSPRERGIRGFISGTYNIFDKVEISAGVRQSHLEYSSAYIANGWINGGPSDSPVATSQKRPRRDSPQSTNSTPQHDLRQRRQGYRLGARIPSSPRSAVPRGRTERHRMAATRSGAMRSAPRTLGLTARSTPASRPTGSTGIRFSSRFCSHAPFT